MCIENINNKERNLIPDTTRKKGLRDEIFQIRRLSNNLRDEIIFRLLSEHLWDETGFLS